MNRFARYVLRLHVVPLVVGFGVITVIFALDFLFEYVDLIVSKGVPPLVVGKLFLLGQGWMIALSVPCSVLVAVLMTFGRLSQDLEISAMRTSGVALLTIFCPLVGAAGLLAVGLTLFNNHILPETNHQFANLMYDIGQKRPAFKLEEGVFLDDFEGYRLLVGHVNARTSQLGDITIYQLHPDRLPTTITARSGELEYDPREDAVTFHLRDGEVHEVPKDSPHKDTYRRLVFRRHTLRIAGVGQALRHTDRTSRSDREMSTRDMLDALHGLDAERRDLLRRAHPVLARYGYRSLEDVDWDAADRSIPARTSHFAALLAFVGQLLHRHRPAPAPLAPEDQAVLQSNLLQLRAVDDQRWSYGVEIQKKFAIPAACVVFVLIGAPLGLRVRRTGPAVAFASLLFFLFYYVTLVGGEELAKHGTLSPFLAMWLPNILIGAIGLYLTLREAEVLPR
ncbi:MAG TPA: LptF/LptG family permease [Candidatus Saccharimonadales bacterium]|nr:LptF/LptG family permease [Candidatus Saccharimonadales bacterium]